MDFPAGEEEHSWTDENSVKEGWETRSLDCGPRLRLNPGAETVDVYEFIVTAQECWNKSLSLRFLTEQTFSLDVLPESKLNYKKQIR